MVPKRIAQLSAEESREVPARELGVGIDERETAIGPPPFCKLPHVVLTGRARVPKKTLSKVLHDSQVTSGKYVQTG